MALILFTRTPLCFAVVALAISSVGCGGVAIHPVSGTVTADGKPVTAGAVVLAPMDEGLSPATGEVQSDGSFKLASTLGEGVVAGQYRALYTAPEATEDEEGNIGEASEFTNWGVPSDYKAEIAEGENSLTIELERTNGA